MVLPLVAPGAGGRVPKKRDVRFSGHLKPNALALATPFCPPMLHSCQHEMTSQLKPSLKASECVVRPALVAWGLFVQLRGDGGS